MLKLIGDVGALIQYAQATQSLDALVCRLQHLDGWGHPRHDVEVFIRSVDVKRQEEDLEFRFVEVAGPEPCAVMTGGLVRHGKCWSVHT